MGKDVGIDFYLKSEVDARLSENDREIAYWREEYDKETKLTDALKAEIESLKVAKNYKGVLKMDFIARQIDGELYVSLDQVNKAIEEKNAEIENINASHYAEMVDAGMRERRLCRALWLARAIQAKNASIFWEEVWTNEVYGSNDVYDINYCVLTDKLKRTPFKWYEVFKHVERKCKAKAEEYK